MTVGKSWAFLPSIGVYTDWKSEREKVDISKQLPVESWHVVQVLKTEQGDKLIWLCDLVPNKSVHIYEGLMGILTEFITFITLFCLT